MQNEHLVEGLPITKIQPVNYVTCAQAKSHRQTFPKSSIRRANAPLDLLHIDIWGPSSEASICGKCYYLLIIDDFSRHMWIYHLAHKSEALCYFSKFKKLRENQVYISVKCIRSVEEGSSCQRSL